MKLVIAIIKPFKLDDVRNALGQIGDGKIFVVDVDHVVRIRTGETDTDAL